MSGLISPSIRCVTTLGPVLRVLFLVLLVIPSGLDDTELTSDRTGRELGSMSVGEESRGISLEGGNSEPRGGVGCGCQSSPLIRPDMHSLSLASMPVVKGPLRHPYE
jgi:hypothetical protein